MSVGLYAQYNTISDVVNASQGGWAGIATAAGTGTTTSPYTSANGQDGIASNAFYENNLSSWWITFWTVGFPASGDTFYNAGYQGGKYVAEQDAGNFYEPVYFILDPEGPNTKPSSKTEWYDFINGWVAGIATEMPQSKAAVYVDGSTYTDYDIAGVGIPVFVAVTPIGTSTPHPAGAYGYCGFYASCPVSTDISTVDGWGGTYNTVQFSGSGILCNP